METENKNMEEKIYPINNQFPIGEAFIDLIYGKIRQGKTYSGTASVWRDLKNGNVVYTSWPIDFDGYDERKIWWMRLLAKIGLKKNFLIIPKENLHYVNVIEMTSEQFFEWLSTKTDCIIYIDEAQWVFDSYIKTMMEKNHRATIFTTGHFNRAIKVIAQRPMQIHTSLRGNIARYYKVEKIFGGFWFIPARFRMTEFQELKSMDAVPDETTDEDGEYIHAESTEEFFMNFEVAGSYDSKYLRGNMPSSQKNLAYYIWRPWLSNFFKPKKVEPKFTEEEINKLKT